MLDATSQHATAEEKRVEVPGLGATLGILGSGQLDQPRVVAGPADDPAQQRGQPVATVDDPLGLALELPRLGLPMRVSAGGGDELVVEFAPLPVPETDIEARSPSADDPGRGPA